MRKPPLFHWVLVTALAVLTAGLEAYGFGPFRRAELAFYDLLSSWRPAPPSDVVLVAIDDRAATAEGSARSKLAPAIEKLHAAGAKAIGLDLPMPPSEAEAMAAELESLRGRIASHMVSRRDPDRPWITLPQGATSQLLLEIEQVRSKFSSGEGLEASIRGRNVVLAASPAVPPSKKLEEAAAAVGWTPSSPDPDGVVRTAALRSNDSGTERRSFALELARLAAGLAPNEVRFAGSDSLHFGAVRIPLERGRFVRPDWRRVGGAPVVSLLDAAEGKVPPSTFKGKIAIIGATAEGLAVRAPTPLSPATPELEIQGAFVDALRGPRLVARPEWAETAGKGELVLVWLAGTFLLPALPPASALAASALLGALLVGAASHALAAGLWLPAAAPLLLLAAATAASLIRPAPASAPSALKSESVVDRDIMLAESFIRGGMLDLAFEHLRNVPLDKKAAAKLYDLGLAFEKRKLWAEALAVYGYIGTRFDSYRDIEERIEELAHRLPQAAQEQPPQDQAPQEQAPEGEPDQSQRTSGKSDV